MAHTFSVKRKGKTYRKTYRDSYNQDIKIRSIDYGTPEGYEFDHEDKEKGIKVYKKKKKKNE
jgi:hypothetical protein